MLRTIPQVGTGGEVRRRRSGVGVGLAVALLMLAAGCDISNKDEGTSPSLEASGKGGSASSTPSGSSSVASLAALRTALRPKGIKCKAPETPPADMFPPPDTHLDLRMDCDAHDISLTFWSGEPGEIDEAIAYIRRTQFCAPATTGATIVDGGWYFVYSQSDHSPDGIGTPKERRLMRTMHQIAADLAGGEVQLLVPGCK